MGTLLNRSELALFDSTTVEVFRLAGVDNAVLYKFNPHPTGVTGTVDCLYEEPRIGAILYTPYKVLGWFEEPTRDYEVGQESGLDIILNSRFFFSRKDLENQKVPVGPDDGERVAAGDIVQIFLKGRFEYFDIKTVEKSGFVNDSQEYTQLRCELVKNQSFTPERKLAGNE